MHRQTTLHELQMVENNNSLSKEIKGAMFLDDELESICQDETICEEKSFMLFQACLKRIPKPDQVRPQDFLNEIRKIEGGWKLFCKRHPQYRPEGFRDLMMKQCGDILSKPVLEYLHWN